MKIGYSRVILFIVFKLSVKQTMRFAGTSKLIALLILTAFLFVLFVDRGTCEGCINFMKSTVNKKGSSGINVSSINEAKASATEPSPNETTDEVFCQACFNASMMVNTRNNKIVLSPVLFRSHTSSLPTPILVSSLFKPPEDQTSLISL